MAIDPVCRMKVDESKGRFVEHRGKRVYFCSPLCEKKFLAEPDADWDARAAEHSSHSPPLLNIGLGPVPLSAKREKKSNAKAYFCPMCPSVQSDVPADCPICGMALEKNPGYRPPKLFRCPDHPDVSQKEPGKCEKCSRPLLGPEAYSAELETRRERKEFREVVTSCTGALAVMFLSMGEMIGIPINQFLSPLANGILQAILAGVVVFFEGWSILTRGWTSIKTGRANMFTLVAVGIVASIALSTYNLIQFALQPSSGETHQHGITLYYEAAAIIAALVLLGQWLEARARKKSQDSLAALVSLAPKTCYVLSGKELIEKEVADVLSGEVIRIRPGDRIPLDGRVLVGESHVDEAMLTGESKPVTKSSKSKVFAGTLNLDGALEVQVIAEAHETALARIIELVSNAQQSRAPIQNLVDRVAAVFTPLVFVASLLTLLLWLAFGSGSDKYSLSLVAAVSVLVVACPCALGLATPMSIMVGVGVGARHGILFKGAEAIERLASIDLVVFDKTGTLTSGAPQVNQIDSLADLTVEKLLYFAAALETNSRHPYAQGIVRKAKELPHGTIPNSPKVTSFKEIRGLGVEGTVDSKSILIGNEDWIRQRIAGESGNKGGSKSLAIPATTALETAAAPRDTRSLSSSTAPQPVNSVGSRQQGDSAIYIAVDGRLAGCFWLGDSLRANAKEEIDRLKGLGMHIAILSGDHPDAVNSVATQLGIEAVRGGLSPEEKLQAIEQYQRDGKRVAMVGDGINDAPALARSDIGIALGTGTDVAMEVSGVTLIHGDISGVSNSIRIARQTVANIKQNLFFAFGYNALGIPVAAGAFYPWLGTLLSPMIAAALMSVSSLSVVANALRLTWLKFQSNH